MIVLQITKEINSTTLIKEIKAEEVEIVSITSIGYSYTFNGVNIEDEPIILQVINDHDANDFITIQAPEYKHRRDDAREMIDSLSAELLQNTDNGVPRAVNQEIEQAYLPLIIMLGSTGWWKTAKEYAEAVVVTENNNPAGYVTQDFKDRIISIIDAYILENYPN